MKKYRGIFPALVTPFDEKGRVDADRMQRLVEKICARAWLAFMWEAAQRSPIFCPWMRESMRWRLSWRQYRERRRR